MMGIVRVTPRTAARLDSGAAIITSGLRATSSAARAGIRSDMPSANRSASVMLRPST